MIELSEEAQRQVEAARAQAEREYWVDRQKLDSGGYAYPVWREYAEVLAVDFLHAVFFAYASKFLHSGAVPAEIRTSAESALTTLIDELLASDKWPTDKPWPDDSPVSLQDFRAVKKLQVINEIKRDPSWGEFQSALAACCTGTGDVGTVNRVLNAKLVETWMHQEGYSVKELAEKLKMSARAVSSMLNNGGYHGSKAVTKLANLMERNPDELYLP